MAGLVGEEERRGGEESVALARLAHNLVVHLPIESARVHDDDEDLAHMYGIIVLSSTASVGRATSPASSLRRICSAWAHRKVKRQLMIRLSDIPTEEAAHVLAKSCDPFDTRPWVVGPPLSERRDAILTSAGLHRVGDPAFATVDLSYRAIPGTTRANELTMSHSSIHFDRTGCREDVNVVFPILAVSVRKYLKQPHSSASKCPRFRGKSRAASKRVRIVSTKGSQISEEPSNEDSVAFLVWAAATVRSRRSEAGRNPAVSRAPSDSAAWASGAPSAHPHSARSCRDTARGSGPRDMSLSLEGPTLLAVHATDSASLLCRTAR